MDPGSPLRYQLSRDDCFPTSVINGLACFFGVRGVPAIVLQRVYMYSLDGVSADGTLGTGTTEEAADLLAEWLNSYRTKKFDLRVDVLKEGEVHVGKRSQLLSCLRGDGVAICDVQYTKSSVHTLLATGVSDPWVYCWDPMYRVSRFRPGNGVEVVSDRVDANLRISLTRLGSHKPRSFSLGPSDERYCILLRRKRRRAA